MKPIRLHFLFLTVLLPLLAGKVFAQSAYIQTDVIKVSGVTSASQVSGLPLSSKRTTFTYLNGLGSPVQTVGYEQSPNSNDVIKIYQYDQYGQAAIDYLPYPDVNSQNTKGSYRTTALTDQQNYYINSSTSGNLNKVANDPLAFSQRLFENSPLRRLVAAGSVGAGFQPDQGDNSQHYTVLSYRNNTAADNVMVAPAAGGTTFYPANTLSVTDAKDADGVETLVFKNAMGQTLLKRKLSGQSTEPYYDTYQVFNADGSLAYILPPKASHLIASGTTNINAQPLSNLIYAYTYDALGRVITRKAPSTGVVSIVYDPMSRPILVQDGNQALSTANQWSYIKYDSKNRPISQGIYTDVNNIGQAAMQNFVNTSYGSVFFESRSSSAATYYYTNSCFPTQNIQQLAFAFYDDYDLTQAGTPKYSYQVQGLVNGSGVSVEDTPIALTAGMLTMIIKRTVGSGLSNIWLSNVYFYDKHNNIIQVQSNNQLNFTAYTVTDYRTIAPDFTGKPIQMQVSKVTGSGTANTNKIHTYLTYDTNNERLQSVSQAYNSQAAVTLVSYSYNEIGQVTGKQLGLSAVTGNYLQTLDFRYNIRGQLLTINNSTLTNDGGVTNNDNTDLFGMSYLYDQTDPNIANATPSYSGKISAVKWSYKYNNGSNTSNERSYVYKYDALGQLNAALYAERAPNSTSATPFNVNQGGFEESGITYDDNGNITALKRYSSTNNGTGGTPLDNLTYTPDPNYPDRLYKVADAVTQTSAYGFNNVAAAPSTSFYQYDADGNLTSDPYKGITISYNLINKTDVITAPNISNSTISYTYDANKVVVRKKVMQGTTLQSTTDYIDEFVYTNGSLGYFSMPEGRVVNASGTLKPEYIITDQQGNARFSFQDNGSGSAVIIQENSYYGYGAVMPNSLVAASPSTNNNNLYNGGSEWQNTFANLPDYYQAGSRNYDPELGRFISVDPLAELSASLSTYHYAGNNPIMANDPSGNCDPDTDAGCDLVVNGPIPGDDTPSTPDTEEGGGGAGDPGSNYSNSDVPASSTSLGGNYNKSTATSSDGTGGTTGNYTTYVDDKGNVIQRMAADVSSTVTVYPIYDVTGPDGNITMRVYSPDPNFMANQMQNATVDSSPGNSSSSGDQGGSAGSSGDGGGGGGGGGVVQQTQAILKQVTKQTSLYENGTTLAKAPALINKTYKAAVEASDAIKFLKYFSKITGTLSLYEDYEGFIEARKEGNAWLESYYAGKALFQIGFLLGGGEEIELGYNLGTMGIDGLISIFHKKE